MYERDEKGQFPVVYEQRDVKQFSPFREEASPVQDKFPSAPMHYQGQYQAYPADELGFFKPPEGYENQEFYQKQGGGGGSGGGGYQGNPQGYHDYPDNKELIFQGYQGQQMYASDQGFPGYQTGFYDSPRVTGPESNFNFSGPSGMFQGVPRQTFSRGPSLALGSPLASDR